MKKNKKKLGDCYEANAKWLIANKENYRELFLCHGIAEGQGEIKGQKLDHAWVEFQDLVFDNSNKKFVVVRKEVYYAIGKISDVKKYSVAQACLMMLRTGHYGFWTDKELANANMALKLMKNESK